MKQKTFILIGRSGCGKDTQMKLIKKRLQELDSERKIIDVKTGSTLRDFWAKEGYTNDLSRKLSEEGDLQPEFLVVYLWSKILMKNMSGDEHLIFDGTPRRLNEAEVLDSAIKFYKREEPTVLYIDVARDWAKEKLLARGRKDDTEELIDERMDWFDTDVMPVLDYLKNNPMYKFLDINGEQTIEEVFEEVKERVGL